jgi:ABC-type lipoprotein export system ATPase subunit
MDRATGADRPGATTVAVDPDPIEIRVRDLRHVYETAAGSLTVLDGVTVAIGRGQIVAIMGSSGSGKTTLLSLLGGLEAPQAGSIEVAGRALDAMSGNELAAFRRETVGFVFQDFGLLGQLTALENVELALTLGGTRRLQRRTRARDLLAAVGLEARVDHRPHALSGGENQRVAIARALANTPRVVLADEPTGNLDAQSTDLVLDLLGRLPREHDCTLLLVTHDDAVAAGANRILHLRNGRVAT